MTTKASKKVIDLWFPRWPRYLTHVDRKLFWEEYSAIPTWVLWLHGAKTHESCLARFATHSLSAFNDLSRLIMGFVRHMGPTRVHLFPNMEDNLAWLARHHVELSEENIARVRNITLLPHSKDADYYLELFDMAVYVELYRDQSCYVTVTEPTHEPSISDLEVGDNIWWCSDRHIPFDVFYGNRGSDLFDFLWFLDGYGFALREQDFDRLRVLLRRIPNLGAMFCEIDRATAVCKCTIYNVVVAEEKKQ